MFHFGKSTACSETSTARAWPTLVRSPWCIQLGLPITFLHQQFQLILRRKKTQSWWRTRILFKKSGGGDAVFSPIDVEMQQMMVSLLSICSTFLSVYSVAMNCWNRLINTPPPPHTHIYRPFYRKMKNSFASSG